jgi:hypothetical protein
MDACAVAMLALDTRPSIEHVGAARAFRMRVADENDRYLAASWRMVEPIQARIKRFPLRNFRIETLRSFERAWRNDMPQTFSIDYEVEWPRHGLTVTERRIGVAEFRDDGWRPDYMEPEVSIGVVTVTLNRKTATVKFSTKAIISLPALARRCQWGWDSSDAALIRDLVEVSTFDVTAIPEGEFFTIPIGSEGAGWRSRAVLTPINNDRTERVIAVRDWWS